MELIRRNIHMNRLKNQVMTQVTLDDDFIVPDIKADIDTMIADSGQVIIDNVRVAAGKVNVKGRLKYSILYGCYSGNKLLHNMSGEIPFDENINCDGIDDGDGVNVKWDLEDLSIGVINTRKISVKALLTLMVVAENIYDIEPVVDVVSDHRIDCLKSALSIAKLTVCKKDIFRIKEDIDIPSNKPNMSELLWHNCKLKSTNVKLLDGKILVSGELQLFALYESEDENGPVQWVETVVPFSGNIDLPECSEEMISDILTTIAGINVNIKPDYDGESRVIELDVVLNLDMKIYNEENIEVVSDVNSSKFNLVPEYEEVEFPNLLVKNISKCKVSDKLKLDSSKGHIMQLCSSEGSVRVEDISIDTDCINVNGVVELDIMYISSDDKMPICITREIIPFDHCVEAPGINKNSTIYIRPSIEQVATNMAGNNEMEVKCVVALDCLAFNILKEQIITSIEENPYDMEMYGKIPAMVGYRVQNGDTLWKIAKKYCTSVESIRNINDIRGDQIKSGEMLLVVKENMI